MTPETEALVRQSWTVVAQHGDRLAKRFYQRLFEIAPDQQRLFATVDMESQRGKFLSMMQEIVNQIDTPEELVPEVAALGSRHAGYGATSRGYGVVGDALLWAMEQELGSELTPETRQAWRDAYVLLAQLMARGASRAAGPGT